MPSQKDNPEDKKSATAVKVSSKAGKVKAKSSKSSKYTFIAKPEVTTPYTGEELFDPSLPDRVEFDLVDNFENSFEKTLDSIKSKLTDESFFESFKETVLTLFEYESKEKGCATDNFDMDELKRIVKEQDLEEYFNCSVEELDK
jgi:hypothetical protein